MPEITVAAVVVRDAHHRVLTVRKRGTDAFMFPGGKPEAGEEPLDAAVREVREELGLDIDPRDLVPLGRWETRAANEEGHDLVGHVFSWVRSAERLGDASVVPRAEIEEIRWSVPEDSLELDDLAPLTRDCVFPVLSAVGPGRMRKRP